MEADQFMDSLLAVDGNPRIVNGPPGCWFPHSPMDANVFSLYQSKPGFFAGKTIIPG